MPLKEQDVRQTVLRTWTENPLISTSELTKICKSSKEPFKGVLENFVILEPLLIESLPTRSSDKMIERKISPALDGDSDDRGIDEMVNSVDLDEAVGIVTCFLFNQLIVKMFLNLLDENLVLLYMKVRSTNGRLCDADIVTRMGL
ncbi:hypothetical protein ILUMI_18917 [Ignelater luminosus]|uniref:Uncharacterized protein n=1 Tax=Ignelater luminosus TaxID=2038154 RepID=A0A8K0CH98_IGNLU|nr:hypothetical protein ILUMI_18917 [Ignelater luminosus]